MLTTVNDSVVRYMSIAGHGSRSIFVYHVKGMALFLGVAAAGSWGSSGPIAAGIVVAASTSMVLIMTLRILAYRLHDKRTADFIVSVILGLLVLIATSNPMATPAVAIAMLWYLHVRGNSKTWLLA